MRSSKLAKKYVVNEEKNAELRMVDNQNDLFHQWLEDISTRLLYHIKESIKSKSIKAYTT